MKNRPTVLLQSTLVIPFLLMLMGIALLFQEDCQARAQTTAGGTMIDIEGPIAGVRMADLVLDADSLANKEIDTVRIPFSASADPADLAWWRIGLSPFAEASFINDENFKGVGGCRCVTWLEYREMSPVFENTKATGYFYFTSSDDGVLLGWQSSARITEVRVNAPDGDLFARTPASAWKLDTWAVSGTKFYLQDVSGGKPLVAENTITVFTIE